MIYIAAMCLALLVTVVHQTVATLRPLLAAVLLWSAIGLVVSTVMYAVASVLVVKAISGALGEEPSAFDGVVMGALIFVGPFVAAIAGEGGGALIALLRPRPKGRA